MPITVELGVYINYIYAISEQTMVGNSHIPHYTMPLYTYYSENTNDLVFLTKFSDLFKGSVCINRDLTAQFLTFY